MESQKRLRRADQRVVEAVVAPEARRAGVIPLPAVAPLSRRQQRARLLPYWRAPIWQHEPPKPIPEGARRLGSVAGIPIFVTAGVVVSPGCFFVLALLIAWWEPELLALNLGTAVAFAVQLVVHEGAHALTAARPGPVAYAAFALRGGVVESGDPERPSPPRRIAAIAAAGPAGNLVAGAGCLAVAVLAAGDAASFWLGAATANVGVAVASLLPLTSAGPVGPSRSDGALIVAALRAGRTGITDTSATSPLK